MTVAFSRAWPGLLLFAGACATTPAVTPPRADTVRIIATNDFHGAFEARPAGGRVLGGAGSLAAAIAQARRECTGRCVSILLDGGDEFQGTPASNFAFGKPVVDLFNLEGYSASALGNHEFDWGQDSLRARMRQAKYPILGANVKYADGRDVEWIQDDAIVRAGGLRIGVIGISTVETPTTTKTENVRELRFVAPAPVVNERARSLRSRGADLVVVVAHAGAFCSADGSTQCRGEIVDSLANRITEKVDAIVSGHTHSLVRTVVNGIPIVQARSSGRAIGIIDIPVGSSNRPLPEVRDVAAAAVAVEARADSIGRAAVAAVAARVNRQVATIATAMARNGAQHALGNLIADAMRAAGKADVAIMNNGGIRADLAAGPVTYGQLFEIQPFGNVLYRVSVTGAQLRTYLSRATIRERSEGVNVHVSGIRLRYDPTKPEATRLLAATMADGSPIRDDQTYTIVISDFLLTGGDDLGPPAGARTTPLNVADLDAFVTYLQNAPQPVVAPTDVRIERVKP